MTSWPWPLVTSPQTFGVERCQAPTRKGQTGNSPKEPCPHLVMQEHPLTLPFPSQEPLTLIDGPAVVSLCKDTSSYSLLHFIDSPVLSSLHRDTPTLPPSLPVFPAQRGPRQEVLFAALETDPTLFSLLVPKHPKEAAERGPSNKNLSSEMLAAGKAEWWVPGVH